MEAFNIHVHVYNHVGTFIYMYVVVDFLIFPKYRGQQVCIACILIKFIRPYILENIHRFDRFMKDLR